jgi:hypothetical protein
MSFEYNWVPDGDPQEDQVVFEATFGPRKYKIKVGDKAQIEKWKDEITELHAAIKSGDLEKLEKLMKDGRYKKSIEKVMELQKKEGLDEEGEKLLAISLLIMKRQSDWKGLFAAGMKLVKGGIRDLDRYFENIDSPSCLDAAVLVEYLTEIHNIKGVITRLAGRYTHWYWQSETGKVVDIWWGYGRGGLYMDQETHKEMKTRYTRSAVVTDHSGRKVKKLKKKKDAPDS